MSREHAFIELPRAEQMVLYVLSLFDDLSERGLVAGGAWRISENCKGIHEDMKAVGIQPSEAEIHDAMEMIQEMSRSPN